ncbi:MAG: FAD:protein FMN transferase [Suilimivivens sp.]
MKKLFSLICSIAILLTGCNSYMNSTAPLKVNGVYFDTIISVTIYKNGSQQILEECMDLAAHYENLLSPNVEGSDVWKINHSNGSFVTVDNDTLMLINTALFYAQLSDGLVDPTIGSLSQLWNFGSDNQELVPEDSLIKTALSHVNYKTIIIRNQQVKLTDPQARIELGFIAKGFIADKMKEFLISKGVTSALINLGGNVLTLGNKPDDTPFQIGIQKPFSPVGTPALTLDVTDSSVVSSGNYERYFEKNGKLYHHILSTDTGYPVDNELSQVTILSTSSVDGDALSTLCYILGYEEAALLLESHPDIRAIFITEDGDTLYANFD